MLHRSSSQFKCKLSFKLRKFCSTSVKQKYKHKTPKSKNRYPNPTTLVLKLKVTSKAGHLKCLKEPLRVHFSPRAGSGIIAGVHQSPMSTCKRAAGILRCPSSTGDASGRKTGRRWAASPEIKQPGSLDYTAKGRIKQPCNTTAGLPEPAGDGGGGERDRAQREEHRR